MNQSNQWPFEIYPAAPYILKQVPIPGFFIGYFFKTQGRQNSTFFKTQAIFLQNSRKISQNSIFRKFLSLWAFFKYSQWSKNEVILTILLHNIECTALTSQSFYSVSAKLNRNSTFFKNSRYFSWKLKKISAQNSIIFAKLNFSEIPFPYDGAKTAKKKACLSTCCGAS